PEKILRGKKDRFLIETDDEIPGFLTIHFDSAHSLKVFLEPGRTNSLKVDMANFDKSLKFEGPHAVQNKFLNNLHREPLLLSGSELLAVRSGEPDEKKPKDYYHDALDNIEAEKKILNRKGKKKFSPAFIKAMEQDITYYYTCRFSEMVAHDYRLYAQNKPSRFSSKWAYYWEKIFEIQPIDQIENALTEYYTLALDYYLGDYLLGYQGHALYPDPDLAIGEQFLEYDRLLWNEFKGKSLEYALASVLSQRALLGKNEPVLFDLFNKYKNDFPNSDYLKPFEKAVAPIGESLKEKKISLPDGIIQLDTDGEINSLKEITDRFKGKVVYMDIWATWCSPCLFEFTQKKPLEKFVEGKDIVLVFISVDNEDRRERWRKIIIDNNLKGYHIMANFSLRDELIDKFGNGRNLALPHYVIYDKNGNLRDGNAKQPSHNNVLFQELKKYID
ncbi:MAG TPA: TlpA family protein disulfide reductase, partial [Bacteroidetes bacterium]|nr:TlpA family protein disulfide reductase [Bacteroidota bacterium]